MTFDQKNEVLNTLIQNRRIYGFDITNALRGIWRAFDCHEERRLKMLKIKRLKGGLDAHRDEIRGILHGN